MENFKKAMGDAGTFLTRAVQDAHIGDEASIIYNRAKQFTEEKLGKAERTELDPHLESLGHRTDHAKVYTERLVKGVEAVLVPNPAARLETFVADSIPGGAADRVAGLVGGATGMGIGGLGGERQRMSNLEYLGGDMVEAGNEFGPGTPYGSALIRVGQTEQSLGETERDYIRRGHEAAIAPLQHFLDGEMRNITRERKILENKRLDLDACKNRVRKARAMQMQPPAESDLRVAQAEYDKQVEITKLLMEGLSSMQTNHLKHLHDFVQAQAQFYADSHRIMQELQQELESLVESNPMSPTLGLDRKRWRAKAISDYDAEGPGQLSLRANEVINVLELEPREEGWLEAERGGGSTQCGRVPRDRVRIF